LAVGWDFANLLIWIESIFHSLLSHKLLLRRRSILETITDQRKNVSQIEHTTHRSLATLMVNVVAGLIAYCHQPKKPSLALNLLQLEALIPN
jgi:hypothetical protein